MKHKYISVVLSVIAGILLSSCGEDFLYKAPQGSIDQNALANQMGIDLLTVNAYANFHENGWGASPSNWTLGSIYGGDANKGSDANDQAVFNEIEMYNALPTNSYPAEKYAWVYKGVKRVNIALQTMAMVEELPDAFQKSRTGELHFLRAVFYFEGIKVFGPYIPWVDDSMTENDPKVYNNIDIYANVLNDIDVAIANLPNTQDAPGRANAWAAKALKAKVLMQQGNMASAKPILKDVVDNGVTSNGLAYKLEDDMNANFDSYRNNGSESIFGIQFSMETNNANPGMSIAYPHGGAGAPGGCCGFFQPSQELANSFKVDANGLPFLDKSYRNAPYVSVQDPAGGGPGRPIAISNTEIAVDPRLDFAISRFGIPYKDWGLPQNNWVRDVGNGGVYLPKKHVYTKAELDAGLASGGIYDGWAPGSAINLQYLSLRDMILLYAECLANDGELAAAMAEVNKIRTRAGLDVNRIMVGGEPAANYQIAPYPSSHAAFISKETCIEAIRFERKLELAMEGQRWFDLARWGGQYMSQQLREYITFEANFLSKFAIASVLSPDKTMFPLPEGQIQTMGNDENGQPYLVQPAPWR
ncbi:Starch-binding associating with outer membrane [Porphyromonadaceae bacterium KH3R12]|uniref:RagB/SusD family nutrient uptake outer membrane protein n=1 Tax=Proteiniphilum saccharofermentans TaxID=1642647 RepID=UPI000894EC42|nr:RagB/SusD family nutrient uptake outer membrane protein [Proteiniphilum saccharofermentans]SDZ87088.1 Starch-binding associating with outer membrane [Porphyromonadaceae bacterium KH3R12]